MKKIIAITAALGIALALASCGGGGGGGGGGSGGGGGGVSNDEAITSANAVDVAYRAVGTVLLSDAAQYTAFDAQATKSGAAPVGPRPPSPGSLILKEVLPKVAFPSASGGIQPTAVLTFFDDEIACGDGSGSVTIDGTRTVDGTTTTIDATFTFDNFVSCSGYKFNGEVTVNRIEDETGIDSILDFNDLSANHIDFNALFTINGFLTQDVDSVNFETTIEANYTWTLNDLTVTVEDFTLFMGEEDPTQVHYIANGKVVVNDKEITVSTPTDIVVDTTTGNPPESGVLRINGNGLLWVTFTHSDDYYITVQLDKNEDGDFADAGLGDFTYGPKTWIEFMTDAGVLIR